MTDLVAAIDLDPEPMRRAMAGDSAAVGAVARTLADARFDAVLERAGAVFIPPSVRGSVYLLCRIVEALETRSGSSSAALSSPARPAP